VCVSVCEVYLLVNELNGTFLLYFAIWYGVIQKLNKKSIFVYCADPVNVKCL